MSSTNPSEIIRADDYIEYYIFPDLSSCSSNTKDVDDFLDALISNLNVDIEQITKDYIWHKDPFCLVKCNSTLLNESQQNEGNASSNIVFNELF